MFKKTGKLLKVFAWITTISGIVGSWAYFFWMIQPAPFYRYGGLFPRSLFFGLLAAIGGTFLSWLAGALIFAIGRIVDNTAAAARASIRQVELMERQTDRWPDAPRLDRPSETNTLHANGSYTLVCSRCGNRQEGELAYCRRCGMKMNHTGDE